jgi:hypothetical protein
LLGQARASLLRNFHAPATAICAAAYGYRVH